MSEGQPLPDFSNKIEVTALTNPYHQAVVENQRMWREAKRGLMRPYEMSRVSENIEAKFKSVFAPYIDPTHPQVLLSISLLADATKDEVPYYFYGNRTLENTSDEDQEASTIGIYYFTEWATNYAARYYLEHVNDNPVTKPLRQLYGQIGDAIIGRTFAIPAYKAMDAVKKTAKARGEDFSPFVFEALFRHNFAPLNTLIASTDTLEPSNIDELAIEVGKSGGSQVFNPKALFTHLLEKPSDPSIIKSLKRTGLSLALGGGHGKPGISEIWLAGPTAVALTSALSDFSFSGNIREAVAEGSLVLGTGFLTQYFLSIHEAVHAYSANSDFIGLTPVQVQRENNG